MENRTVSELIKKFESHCASNKPKSNPGTDCCSKEKFLASSARIQKYYENRIRVNTAVIWDKADTQIDGDEHWEQGDYDDPQTDDDDHSNVSQGSYDVFFSATSLTAGLNVNDPDLRSNIIEVPPLQLDGGNIEPSDNELGAESATTLYSFTSDECDQTQVAQEGSASDDYDDLSTLIRDECTDSELTQRAHDTTTCPWSQTDVPMSEEVETLFNSYCNFVVVEDVEMKFTEMFRDAFRDDQDAINDAVRLFTDLLP